MKNRAEMLADLFAFSYRWTRDAVAKMPEAMLRWRPDPEANTIALTVWHVARMTDIFKTRFIAGGAQDEELWFSGGWAERTGYDPRGIGIQGMGGLLGYSADEVADVPAFAREELLFYFDATLEAMVEHLRALDDEALDAPRKGISVEQSAYAFARHILMDATRHSGEIFAIAEMWRRRNPGEVEPFMP